MHFRHFSITFSSFYRFGSRLPCETTQNTSKNLLFSLLFIEKPRSQQTLMKFQCIPFACRFRSFIVDDIVIRYCVLRVSLFSFRCSAVPCCRFFLLRLLLLLCTIHSKYARCYGQCYVCNTNTYQQETHSQFL